MMRNWLVTGVLGRIGRTIAVKAVKWGDQVIGTLRKAYELPAFEGLATARTYGV